MKINDPTSNVQTNSVISTQNETGQPGSAVESMPISRNVSRKLKPQMPLEDPVDEAVAQYVATPRLFRDFRSWSELADRFGISRMTAYRRSKELHVLQRVQWLVTNHKMAGDLVVKVNWERIVKGQVRAAVRGATGAAEFCKKVAWEDTQIFDS